MSDKIAEAVGILLAIGLISMAISLGALLALSPIWALMLLYHLVVA